MVVYPRWRGELERTRDQGGYLPVYPRWRGELSQQVTRTESKIGLSPLARGTRIILAYLTMR